MDSKETQMNRTIGIFSKLGAAGGSENRVLHLANCFSKYLTTYIFAEKSFSSRLKPQLTKEVILRENTCSTQQYQYELSGLDLLIVVNSDSYSFCKTSYWNGKQAKHHTSNIDISQVKQIAFLFNYVVGPAQNLVKLCKVNPNIKIMVTSEWFLHLIKTEKKFGELRQTNLFKDILVINSPVSEDYLVSKTPSKRIRINRHSMAFAYKHDEDNIEIVEHLCQKYGDCISFQWMGVPSQVRDTNSTKKDDKVPYSSKLSIHPQMHMLAPYAISVPELLQQTDILFFNISRHRKEPWPRTIAEGMMGGCCCVTNNSCGMKEQIEHGKTGFLFDNKEQAIEQLSNLIDNPDLVAQVGQAAQQNAKEHFLDSSVVEKILKFMQD